MKLNGNAILLLLIMFLQSLLSPPHRWLAGIVTIGTCLLAACSTSSIPSGTGMQTEQVANAGGVTQSEEKPRLFGILPIYRADIQQGNFVSKEMVAQLRVGMTPEQVRFVLGTPLLNDAFHAERCDYPFRIKDGKGKVTSSHVSVFFKDGRVTHFEGGDLPNEKDYLQRIAAPKQYSPQRD
jgi:outer membrane protein assembly factor BamE